MANWLREYRIRAGVPGQAGFEIGPPKKGRALHVTFDLEKTDSESGNTGKVTIDNLSDEHKAILNEKGCVVEISAGYIGTGVYIIFVGGVSNTTEELGEADRTVNIELIDGFSNFDRPGTMSMNDVVTGGMVLDEIKEQMGVESVLITPTAQEKLEAAMYDNGYCFVGRMKEALHKLCVKAGLSFTLQNGTLQIYEEGEAVTNQVFVLSKETGLISIPRKITISQSGDSTAATASYGDSTVESGIPGYEVEYFINGAIGINDLVELRSNQISGVFRVHTQHYEGDNYDGDWKCTAQLVEVTG